MQNLQVKLLSIIYIYKWNVVMSRNCIKEKYVMWIFHSFWCKYYEVHFILQSLAQLLCDLKEQNRVLKRENDDLKQNLDDAKGDIKVCFTADISRQFSVVTQFFF